MQGHTHASQTHIKGAHNSTIPVNLIGVILILIMIMMIIIVIIVVIIIVIIFLSLPQTVFN